MNYKDIEIVTLDSSNIKDAYSLHTEVFPQTISYQQFGKKYSTNYSGFSNISQIAYYKNIPIAFNGFLPALIYHQEGKIRAAQSCDSITLEKYRRHGIWSQVILKSYEKIKENNCDFVIGFFTEISRKAFLKLNWKISKNRVFYFNIQVQPIPGWKIFTRFYPGNEILWLKNKLSNYFEISESIENILNDENACSYIYNPEYINYKISLTSFIIKVDELKFWVKPKSYFEIGAVEYKDKSSLRKGIEKLKNILKKFFFQEILIYAPLNSKLYADLEEMYKPFPGWEIGFFDFSDNFSGENIMCNSADIDTY